MSRKAVTALSPYIESLKDLRTPVLGSRKSSHSPEKRKTNVLTDSNIEDLSQAMLDLDLESPFTAKKTK